ncbi:ssl1498 family light-harvesting-like protein [Synechococcus sp. J7-Johnson]|uniref:photosystem II assembly protein Psb34 n=1 Tax=Synechococcus sp. J7-Johnson TaxID=2823737 RepID=UPI0020CF3801|nr:ssl1498 family light-harvesting-like protein [Synechococcus sp. J7-Johnson]MCP9839942.1 ssl1498 family light-harvesting-like protein [Synechococcus sp. J7-Johnson]
MSVTEEDGGKLNAFAREPRMEVIEAGTGRSRSTILLLLGGVMLVLLMLAVAAAIS